MKYLIVLHNNSIRRSKPLILFIIFRLYKLNNENRLTFDFAKIGGFCFYSSISTTCYNLIFIRMQIFKNFKFI